MKTILQKFIDEKTAEYTPPTSKREGGLSEQKYKATLLFLTNNLQEDIAKKTGVSFGLLRKWRTEKRFLDKISEHNKDFTAIFIETMGKFSPELFKDLPNYNPLLLTAIFKEMSSFAITKNDAGIAILTNYFLILKRYIHGTVLENPILNGAKELLIRVILVKIKASTNDEKILAYVKILEGVL